jgi:hypothetical protein
LAILQAELEVSELHLDEDTFMMYGREGGRFVDLVDEKRLDDYHILDRSTLQLKVSFSNCGGSPLVIASQMKMMMDLRLENEPHISYGLSLSQFGTLGSYVSSSSCNILNSRSYKG